MADVELTDVVVTVHIGATVNLGDFNNYKPEFTISAKVPDGESPSAAKDRLERTVRAWLDESLDKVAGKQIR